MSELDDLAAQQKRDDISYQDPQRFAGVRAVPLQKFVDHGRDGSDMETVRDTVDHGTTEVGGVARPLTRWGLGRTHPVYRPRTVRDRDTLFRACEDLLTSLPIDKEQTVREVVYGCRSQRGAAAFFGVSHVAILKRLRASFAMMRTTLEERSGSAGMDFPGSRPFDESAKCRAPKCEGHFEPTSCDCGTVLPHHYNPHTSCRVHTASTTRSEYNLDFILGRAHAAGLSARSAPALDGDVQEGAA